jgi:esterase/lipase
MRKGRLWEGRDDIGIVIIQGWTSYLRQITPLAKNLNQEGHWVYAPILAGHNTKPEKLEGVVWQDWLKNTIEAIDEIKKNKKIKKVFLIGVSFGGNLSILASRKRKIDGIILISTPIFFRDHYWTIISTLLLSLFKKNLNKRYPKEWLIKQKRPSSYNYFPIKSSLECFKLIRQSQKKLGLMEVPFFIIQTNKDYLVAPYSPLLMYNKIKSKQKSLYWMETEDGIHIDFATAPKKYGEVVNNFIKEN